MKEVHQYFMAGMMSGACLFLIITTTLHAFSEPKIDPIPSKTFQYNETCEVYEVCDYKDVLFLCNTMDCQKEFRCDIEKICEEVEQ